MNLFIRILYNKRMWKHKLDKKRKKVIEKTCYTKGECQKV